MMQAIDNVNLFTSLRHPCRCGCGLMPKLGNDYFHGHRKRQTGLVICKSCEQQKPRSEFYISKKTHFWMCKACVSADHKKKRRDWTPARREQNRVSQLRYRCKQLGISEEEYTARWKAQDGYCAICGTKEQPDEKKMHIDHSHKTGKVRGFLCKKCNWALGLFRDDQKTLQRAMEYLVKWE